MAYANVVADLRSAYDRAANRRDVMPDAQWKHAERARFGDLLRALGGQSILEVGAGHGVSGRFFADEGFDVVCTDASPELVQRCRAKGMTSHVMDLLHLEFPQETFDAVFAMNCLYHVPREDLVTALRSVRGVLKPGGLFYWGQFGGEDFEGVPAEDDHEPQRFFSLLTNEQIVRFAAEIFDVTDFRSFQPGGHTGAGSINYQAMVYQALILEPTDR